MLGVLVAIAISSQVVGDCGCHQQQPSYPVYSQPSYPVYPQPSYPVYPQPPYTPYSQPPSWSPNIIIFRL